MKHLTKFLLLLLITCTAFSCSKEEDQQCNCGTITADEIFFDNNSNMIYTLTVQNECTGNLGTYEFSEQVWLNNFVGDYFCIGNVEIWNIQPTHTKVEKVGKTIVE